MTRLIAAGIFTAGLWKQIEPIYNKILACEFISSLTSGNLGQQVFAHYLSQDVLYLQKDSEALELVAGKAVRQDHRAFFMKMAVEGLTVEKIMHDEYMTFFHVSPAAFQSKAFSAYSEFLLQHAADSPYPVAAAALLPCFWVYAKTGAAVLQNSIPGNPYQKFIDTYSGDEIEVYVNQFITIVEELAQEAGPLVQGLMQKAFIRGTEYELEVFEECADQYSPG